MASLCLPLGLQVREAVGDPVDVLLELRGLPKVDWRFTFAAAAYNLVRVPKLIAAMTAPPRAVN